MAQPLLDFDGTNELLRNHPRIFQFAKVVNYKKRDIIFQQGEYGNFVCILLQGTLAAYRVARNGHRRLLRFFRPNDIYGSITLIDGIAHHTMTVEVLEPAVNLEIPKGRLEQLIAEEPKILRYLFEDMARKLICSGQRTEDDFLTAEQKIVKNIMNICEQFGQQAKNGVVLKLDLTQDDLARYSGTNRVTVAKLLSSLTDQGILQIKPKPWIIYRLDELIHYSP